MICGYHLLLLSLIIICRDINLTDLCTYISYISFMQNAFVHGSMSFLYLSRAYIGDMISILCIQFRRHSYYNNNLRCLLYLFSFGHVFFRASANCRLYQTADSTETPLLAQVSSLLSFSLSSAFSSLSHAWPDSDIRETFIIHVTLSFYLHAITFYTI